MVYVCVGDVKGVAAPVDELLVHLTSVTSIPYPVTFVSIT